MATRKPKARDLDAPSPKKAPKAEPVENPDGALDRGRAFWPTAHPGNAPDAPPPVPVETPPGAPKK